LTEKKLYALLNQHFKDELGAHGMKVEPHAMPGVADANWCIDGIEVWVELKVLRSNQFRKPLGKEQVVWLIRRCRAGGRAWVLAHDEGRNRLLLWNGRYARALAQRRPVDVPCQLIQEKPYRYKMLAERMVR